MPSRTSLNLFIVLRGQLDDAASQTRDQTYRREVLFGCGDVQKDCQRHVVLRNFLQADHFARSIFQLPAIHGRRYCLLMSFAMQDNLPDGELLASPQS